MGIPFHFPRGSKRTAAVGFWNRLTAPSLALFAVAFVAWSAAGCGSKGSDGKATSDAKAKSSSASAAKSGSAKNDNAVGKAREPHKMSASDVCLNGPPPKGSKANQLVTADEYMWPNGSVIQVGFLDGTAEQIQIVIEEASEWMKYANIKFEWYPDPSSRPNDLDELVTFNKCEPGDGPAWYVRGAGPASKHFGKRGEFSICLSAFDPEVSQGDEKHARASVKHEFGHVIGLMHEQFNPDLVGKVHWDRDYVHEWCKKTQNWDEGQCDAQVMATLNDIEPRNHWKATKFDPDSIMFYGIKDPNFTQERVVYPQPLSLSEVDKSAVAQMYPGADPSKSEPPKKCKKGDPGCDEDKEPPPATAGGFSVETASRRMGSEDGGVKWGIVVRVKGDSDNIKRVSYSFPPEVEEKPVKGDHTHPGFPVAGSTVLAADITGFKVRAKIEEKDGTLRVVDGDFSLEGNGKTPPELEEMIKTVD